tara:strand:+ start:598 stop:939 length:342 start_codon:yes stop_codon:yes gene_type:complete
MCSELVLTATRIAVPSFDLGLTVGTLRKLMPRETKRADEKAIKARESLITTIAKIHDLEPTLGGKWKTKMENYYISRLAGLILYQSGFSNPSPEAQAAIEIGIRRSLDFSIPE